MSEEQRENNKAYIAGKIAGGFKYSHEVFGERFYRTDVQVCRTSGVMDMIPLMVSEKLMDVKRDYTGCSIEAWGQFRSYNRKETDRRKLELSVLVQEIRFPEEGGGNYDDSSQILLEGYICRTPVYRKTPKGRDIADILLAVNRSYGKSDYIPCICWGRNAMLASRLAVGCGIRVSGRIQSREYVKRLSETESEVRVAYEVSACSLERER